MLSLIQTSIIRMQLLGSFLAWCILWMRNKAVYSTRQRNIFDLGFHSLFTQPVSISREPNIFYLRKWLLGKFFKTIWPSSFLQRKESPCHQNSGSNKQANPITPENGNIASACTPLVTTSSQLTTASISVRPFVRVTARPGKYFYFSLVPPYLVKNLQLILKSIELTVGL